MGNQKNIISFLKKEKVMKNDNKRCFLFTGGNDFHPHLLKHLPCENDFIAVADSGIFNLKRTNIYLIPDLIIGDMDSYDIDKARKEYPECKIILLPSEKNDTDTLYSLKYLIKSRFKTIHIIGGIGSRVDHTFVNALSLKYAFSQGVFATLDNGKNYIIYLENSHFTITKRKETQRSYVSVIPLSDKIEGLTLKGFKYPLINAKVYLEDVYTVSNELIDDIGEIIIKKGSILLTESFD